MQNTGLKSAFNYRLMLQKAFCLHHLFQHHHQTINPILPLVALSICDSKCDDPFFSKKLGFLVNTAGFVVICQQP